MNQLSIIWEPPCDVDALRQQLAETFDLRFVGIDRMQQYQPEQYTLVHADMKDTSRLPDLKEWLKGRPKHAKVICAVDKASHIEVTRAHAIGANDVIHRPLRREELLAKIWGDFTGIDSGRADFQAAEVPGVVAAVDALESIFSVACIGGKLDPVAINSAGDQIVSQIGSQGLASWIETVRKHHSQTYQHCLLVTGVAVGFGQQLGVSRNDRMRLSFAAMLHDVGKARVPVAILEKPGPLDAEEWVVMKKHPQYGVDALTMGPALPSEMIDMVLHHHEYLDGSGYPDGLQAHAISDLVRIMTISDIFAALIELRPYKSPKSGEAAYKILLDMGAKLDKDLVREFQPLSRLGFATGVAA